MSFSSDPEPDPGSEIRPSPIAGRWYSEAPDRLRKQINQYLDDARVPLIRDDIIALIAPHAGYLYSGKTAGYAYRSIQGKTFDLVIIFSPHHAYHEGNVITSGHTAYTTPLGNVPIHRTAVNELAKGLSEEGVDLHIVKNDEEHALEIQLPFLQCALQGSFSILPVMVRNQDIHLPDRLGSIIAKIAEKRKTLLVASTDLSHFYPETIANDLDQEMMKQFASLSPQGVLAAERNGTGYACGAFGTAAAIQAAKLLGANTVEHLHYSTSAEQTRDRSSVVGYGASAIIKRL